MRSFIVFVTNQLFNLSVGVDPTYCTESLHGYLTLVQRGDELSRVVGADYSIRHEQPGSLPVTSQPTTPVRVAPSSPSPSFLASPFCEIP